MCSSAFEPLNARGWLQVDARSLTSVRVVDRESDERLQAKSGPRPSVQHLNCVAYHAALVLPHCGDLSPFHQARLARRGVTTATYQPSASRSQHRKTCSTPRKSAKQRVPATHLRVRGGFGYGAPKRQDRDRHAHPRGAGSGRRSADSCGRRSSSGCSGRAEGSRNRCSCSMWASRPRGKRATSIKKSSSSADALEVRSPLGKDWSALTAGRRSCGT